jgi:chromosome partition protein MukE
MNDGALDDELSGRDPGPSEARPLGQGFSELGDVVSDASFPEVDLALRRGRHVHKAEEEWYAFLCEAQLLLEDFYRRYGCELVHRSDGYFFLLPISDALGKRHLSVAEMIVGQGLALAYLDPASVKNGGITTREELLSQLASVMGTDALMRTLNPKRKRPDERVMQRTVRTKVNEALRRLAQLGFVELLEGDQLRLPPSLMRFAEPVRGLDAPSEALEQLLERGEISLGPGDAEGDDAVGDDAVEVDADVDADATDHDLATSGKSDPMQGAEAMWDDDPFQTPIRPPQPAEHALADSDSEDDSDSDDDTTEDDSEDLFESDDDPDSGDVDAIAPGESPEPDSSPATNFSWPAEGATADGDIEPDDATHEDPTDDGGDPDDELYTPPGSESAAPTQYAWPSDAATSDAATSDPDDEPYASPGSESAAPTQYAWPNDATTHAADADEPTHESALPDELDGDDDGHADAQPTPPPAPAVKPVPEIPDNYDHLDLEWDTMPGDEEA